MSQLSGFDGFRRCRLREFGFGNFSISLSGYVFMCNGGPIIWRTELQPVVAQSTCESEYIALNVVAREAEWARLVYNQLINGNRSAPESVLVYEDNQGAKALAESFILSRRSRHIRVRFHYVRQQLRDAVIKVEYISTTAQLADIMTKLLGPQKHEHFASQLVRDPILS